MSVNKVIQAFGQCKDTEYSCLLHLFEELIPLCFLHYPVIVRGGQFEQLALSMKRLAIMFVAMDRHHYNKASLSWISDVQHQQKNFPDYHAAKSAICSVLNEKKVEIFHSTLRSLGYRWPSSRPQPVDCDAEACHQGWTLALARSPRRVSKVSGECKSQITRPFGECDFSLPRN